MASFSPRSFFVQRAPAASACQPGGAPVAGDSFFLQTGQQAQDDLAIEQLHHGTQAQEGTERDGHVSAPALGQDVEWTGEEGGQAAA